MIKKQNNNIYSKHTYFFVYFFVVFISLFFISLFLLLSTCINNNDTLIITEVCSHNKSIIYDYYCEYSDYVEICNFSKKNIDLSDYFLSDDNNKLFKNVLPNYVIKPNEHYVIFLDSRHFNFNLNDEETIFLTNVNGHIVSQVYLPITNADQVVLFDDNNNEYVVGNSKLNINNEVYIKDANTDGTILNCQILSNYDSGFYSDPFYLELLSPQNGVDIYYTLDSTEPSVNSTKYTKPIYIYDKSINDNLYSCVSNISAYADNLPNYKVNKCQIVRAVGIDEKGNKTKEIYRSFFINYDNKKGYNQLSTISLIINPDNLFNYKDGIYTKGIAYDRYGNFSKLKIHNKTIKELDGFSRNFLPANYKIEGDSFKKEAVIEYIEKGKIQSRNSVKISIHGQTSNAYNQKSFNLFNNDGDIFLDGLFGNNSSCVLRSGGSEVYSSKIRDVLNQELVSSRNVTTFDYKPVQLFIDGEYWGLYMLQERLDKQTISNKYEVNIDDILLIKPGNVIDDDKKYINDLLELENFIIENNMNDETNYQKVIDRIDIQSYIDYKCFDVYSDRQDGIRNHNNYALWKTKIIKNDLNYYDGKYRLIVYDADSSSSADDITCLNDDLLFENDELFISLIKNDNFKKQFIISYMDMINSNYDYDIVRKKINDLQIKIEDGAVESHRRFFDENYSLEKYRNEIKIIDNFFKLRKNYAVENLIKDLDISQKKYQIKIENKKNINYSINTIDNINTSFTGDYFSSYPITIKASKNEVIGFNVNGTYYDGSILSFDIEKDTIVNFIYK